MTAALIAQLALATFIATQFTKFIVDSVVSPTNPNQNNIVRLYVYGVAIAVCAFAVPLVPIRDAVSALADAKLLLVDGFLVFSAAVASYHIATGLDEPGIASSLKGVVGYSPVPYDAVPGLPIAAEPNPVDPAPPAA